MTLFSNKVKLFLKLFISVCLIGFVLYRVDLASLAEKLRQIPWYLLLYIPLLSLVHVFVDTLTKRNIFSLFSYKISNVKLFKGLLIGSFYGFFMPSIIGSDAYFLVFFGNKYKSFSRITSGLLVYKAISLSIFAVLAGISVIVLWASLQQILIFDMHKLNLYIIIFAIFLLLMLLLVVILKSKLFIWIKQKVLQVSEIKAELLGNMLALVRIGIFAFLFYVVSIGGRYIMACILGIDIPSITLMMIILMVNFIVMLPVTISGIGLREASYIILFQSYGVKQDAALLMSLFDFLISLSGVLIGALVVLKDDIRAVRIKEKEGAHE